MGNLIFVICALVLILIAFTIGKAVGYTEAIDEVSEVVMVLSDNEDIREAVRYLKEH